MTPIFRLALTTICFYASVLSINAQDCSEKIRKSNEQYDKKDFKTALRTFQSAIIAKCPLTEIEYYNGACIASLAGQTNLALSYLAKSVAKGYFDTAHMAKDTDLDNIRKTAGYKSILSTIRLRYAELKAELAKLKPDYYYDMIPYAKGGKWGWLDRSSLTPVTKPIFAYTDFESRDGLYFVFGRKPYMLSRYGEVEDAPEYADQGGLSDIAEIDNDPEATDIKGFEHDGRKITRYSKAYTHVTLVEIWDIMSKIALVTDHKDNKGIIAMNGDFLPPFDLRHKEIHHFGNRMNSAVFLTKKEGDATYTIYDINSNQVPVNGITDFDFPYNFQQNTLGQDLYVGYYHQFFVTRKTGKNIFDAERKKLLFPKDYKDIIFINGPTHDRNKSGSYGSSGIKSRYFFVTDGTRSFYVDESGTEFIPKITTTR